MIKNIKWIFFDLGSTLVDESECYKKRYAELAKAVGISAVEFENRAIEYAKQNKKGDHAAAAYYGVTIPKWHKELEVLYPDVSFVLAILKNKGYKLGVIANQSLGSKERLANWGILQYFDVVMASAEEGVAKPDTEIFLRALSDAGCAPENAVMIGDRLDNDIVPANKIGMTTIWIKQGFGKYAVAETKLEKADFVVGDLMELIELL